MAKKPNPTIKQLTKKLNQKQAQHEAINEEINDIIQKHNEKITPLRDKSDQYREEIQKIERRIKGKIQYRLKKKYNELLELGQTLHHLLENNVPLNVNVISGLRYYSKSGREMECSGIDFPYQAYDTTPEQFETINNILEKFGLPLPRSDNTSYNRGLPRSIAINRIDVARELFQSGISPQQWSHNFVFVDSRSYYTRFSWEEQTTGIVYEEKDD